MISSTRHKVASSGSRKIFLVAGIMMLNVPFLSAAATDDLPSAESILDGHVQATGGKQAHLALTSRKMTGTLTADMSGHTLNAKIEVHALAPNNNHLVIESPQMFLIRATNGKQAWEWNAGHRHEPGEKLDDSFLKENTQLMQGPDMERFIEQAQFHASVQWRDRLKQVKTVGLSEVQGQPAYQVQVTTKQGDKYTQFYDKKSGRLVKYVRTVETSNSGKIDMEVLLSDYREFDGVLIATKIHQILDTQGIGSGTQTWTYSDIQHNVNMPENLFQLPDELTEEQDKQPQY